MNATRFSLAFPLTPIQGSRLLLNLRSLSDPDRTELEMSTNLRFTGRPHGGTTIGGSELSGTTYTIGATTEGYGTETDREDRPSTTQEVETGPSRSKGCNSRHAV